jgi:hypothetical protein
LRHICESVVENEGKESDCCFPQQWISSASVERTLLALLNPTFLLYPVEQTFKMPASFSSTVGEFMATLIPKHCPTIVKNQYHNGHPDLIPAGIFPNNAVHHATEGIEIKASRYLRGWQGHNSEDAWLMVFVFDSNRPIDYLTSPKPFRFVMVVGAQLTKEDWMFSGRSETSRRTITASVKRSGYEKMMANWIYKVPEMARAETVEHLQPPEPQPLEPPDQE